MVRIAGHVTTSPSARAPPGAEVDTPPAAYPSLPRRGRAGYRYSPLPPHTRSSADDFYCRGTGLRCHHVRLLHHRGRERRQPGRYRLLLAGTGSVVPARARNDIEQRARRLSPGAVALARPTRGGLAMTGHVTIAAACRRTTHCRSVLLPPPTVAGRGRLFVGHRQVAEALAGFMSPGRSWSWPRLPTTVVVTRAPGSIVGWVRIGAS